jgi:hypothetical protein
VINDLDSTLEGLLGHDLPGVTVSFDTPDGTFAPSLPTVDLFLYDVRENRELRENDWAVERAEPTAVTRRQPPVRIDCSYLVTAWASDTRNEHLLLSRVVRVLLRYPVLPSEALVGTLQNQEPPLPTSTLTPGHLQSAAEFWQAMGGKPKAAFNYTVTIGMEVFEAIEAPVVLETSVGMRHLTRKQ